MGFEWFSLQSPSLGENDGGGIQEDIPHKIPSQRIAWLSTHTCHSRAEYCESKGPGVLMTPVKEKKSCKTRMRKRFPTSANIKSLDGCLVWVLSAWIMDVMSTHGG